MQVEGRGKMAITFLDKDLKGEYKDAYERVEIYVQTMYMNEEMADEMLMNLLDSLLNAQAEGVPVEKIVGRDIKQFCKDYFAVYGKKEWLADFLKSIYRLAWVVFILELLEMTSSEEPFSISMTSDTWGYLVGAAIGGLFLVFDHLVVRPFVYRARKVNSTVYSTGRMVIVIALFIAAIFLTPDIIKNNRVVSAIFMGIRPAVVALIIAPVITSAKAAKLQWKTVWIPLVVALLISLDMGLISNPIFFIVLGGLGGFLFWWIPKRRVR